MKLLTESDELKLNSGNGTLKMQQFVLAILLFSLQREKDLKSDSYHGSIEDIEMGSFAVSLAQIVLGADFFVNSDWVSRCAKSTHVEISELFINALIDHMIPSFSPDNNFYVISIECNSDTTFKNNWKSSLQHPGSLILWQEEQVCLAGGYDYLKGKYMIYKLNKF